MQVLSRCLSLRWFPRQQEYDNVAFDMTEGIISLTNRDNRHREGWGREREGGWINGLIFTQREKQQQQILTILHPSSIFLYCPQWIPAGRHTHALPREQPASIGKLNNSQGKWELEGTDLWWWLPFNAKALNQVLSLLSVAPVKTWNEQAAWTCVFHQWERANQPAMWNHRGAGLNRVIFFPLLYKWNCKGLEAIF